MKHRTGKPIRAFSLVEIVVAMTIMALISGTVMAILMQAADTAADIRDTDRKDEEVSRFLELLERTVESLPVDASIEMVTSSESVSGATEMKITNAIGAFTFGEDIGTAGELTIGLQPQAEDKYGEGGNLFELSISRDSFSPEDSDGDGMVFGAGNEDFLTADSEGRYWLPLVSNIIGVKWRYWDEENREWLEEWAEDNLPPLMEFTVEDSHRPGPIRVVFEIPEHLVTGEGVEPEDGTTQPATTDETTSTTSTVSRPQPGGAGGGRPGGKGGFGGKGGQKGFGGKGGQRGGGFGPGGGGRGGGGGGPRGGGSQGGTNSPPPSATPTPTR